jgi:hypothetical protein
MSIAEVIGDLDKMGLCFLGYDDGSLHNKNLFYNINTHALSKDIQEKYLIPKLVSMGLSGATLFSETKKNGDKYNYISIPKLKGSFEFDEVLRQLDTKVYDYKLLPEDYKQAYSFIKIKFHNKLMSQITLSKLISERLSGETELLDRLREVGGILTYAKQTTAKISKNSLIVL